MKNESRELKHLVRECPYCNGIVLEVAIKCRHCGKFVYDPDHNQRVYDHPNRARLKNRLNRPVCAFSQITSLILIGLGFYKIHTVYWALVLFFFGIAFWMVGAMGARWKRCSNCDCTIAHKDVSKCPRCYFEFLE